MMKHLPLLPLLLLFVLNFVRIASASTSNIFENKQITAEQSLRQSAKYLADPSREIPNLISPTDSIGWTPSNFASYLSQKEEREISRQQRGYARPNDRAPPGATFKSNLPLFVIYANNQTLFSQNKTRCTLFHQKGTRFTSSGGKA